MKKYPVLNIQSDWNEVLRPDGGVAWISAKGLNELSVEGKLKSDACDIKVKISGCKGFQVVNHTTSGLTVKHEESGLTVVFVAPMKTYKVHNKGIHSVSVAENALVVSSCSADRLIVWDSRTAELLHTLEGHAGPAYKSKFFPSGVVVLSAGADSTLRIWSAETGVCPVTLKGHSMAVSDIAIIDRGRNVVSASKDGKGKLWDVGEAKCLDDIIIANGELNCCCLVNTNESCEVQNEREVGTSDKLLVVGAENGTVYCSHIGGRSSKFTKEYSSAVNCCIAIDNIIAIGCQDGKVSVISAIDGSTTTEFTESASPVTSMVAVPASIIIVGHQDGTCMMYSLNKEHEALRVALTGSDCDPIRDISHNGRWVFVGCRDSTIRKYDINQLSVHFK